MEILTCDTRISGYLLNKPYLSRYEWLEAKTREKARQVEWG
jgi:hypothetical protein